MATTKATTKRKVAVTQMHVALTLEQFVRRSRLRAQDHPHRARAARLQGLPAVPLRPRSHRDRRPRDARYALRRWAPPRSRCRNWAWAWPTRPRSRRCSWRPGRNSTTSRSFRTSSGRISAARPRRATSTTGPVAWPSSRRVAAGPIVAHGIGLSIGSAGIFDTAHVDQVERWRRRLGFAWHSDHLVFHLAEHGDQSDERRHHPAAAARSRNAGAAGAAHPRDSPARAGAVPAREQRLLLRHPGAARWTSRPSSTASAAKAAAGLVLDLHNVYTNARNHGFDAAAMLAEL